MDGIRTHLMDNDHLESKRNKFQLRRPPSRTDFELRLENGRVFYRVEEGVHRVKTKIALVGEKQGGRLMIEGEEFAL